MENLAWELLVSKDFPDPTAHTRGQPSVPCAHLPFTNEFPSLFQKVDTTLVFLPPPGTETQTLPLQNTVLSRSAGSWKCKLKSLKDEKIPGAFCGILESASGQITHCDKFFPNCDISIMPSTNN